MNKQHLSLCNYPATRLTDNKRLQFGRHHSRLATQLHLWITLTAWGGGLLLLIGALVMIRPLSNLILTPPAATTTGRSTISPMVAKVASTSAAVGSIFIDTSALARSSTVKNPTAPATSLHPNIPALQQFMLTLINNDRRANGLPELAWNNTAATAGLRHAGEMARSGYLNHHNLTGYGPDYRYALAGGLDAVRENAYVHQLRFGAGPTSPEQWQELIRHAQQLLMESPIHRSNILAAEHTHVGIGLAYEPANGWLTITQEFVDRYVTLQPFPRQVSPDDTITIVGKLENSASKPLLNLAYEPLPKPMTASELKVAGAYSSAAKTYKAIPLMVDSQGRFEQSITLNNKGRAGLYHIRVWADTAFGKVLAADVVVKAQ